MRKRKVPVRPAQWTTRTDKTWGTVYRLLSGRRIVLELFWVAKRYDRDGEASRTGWRLALEALPGSPDLTVWLPRHLKADQVELAKTRSVRLLFNMCAERSHECHLAQMAVIHLLEDSNG
jgi:hypothetical protein